MLVARMDSQNLRARDHLSDKCDDRRKITYKTPSGREQKEDCLCAKYTYTYYPKSIDCYKISQYKGSRNREYPTPCLYFSRESDNDYDVYNRTTNVYSGDNFEKINRYGIVFLIKEDCQKYCEWRNKHKD